MSKSRTGLLMDENAYENLKVQIKSCWGCI